MEYQWKRRLMLSSDKNENKNKILGNVGSERGWTFYSTQNWAKLLNIPKTFAEKYFPKVFLVLEKYG